MGLALASHCSWPVGLGALALPPRLAHAHRLPSAILGHRWPDATRAMVDFFQGSGSQPGSSHCPCLGDGASGSRPASRREPSTPRVPEKWGQCQGTHGQVLTSPGTPRVALTRGQKGTGCLLHGPESRSSQARGASSPQDRQLGVVKPLPALCALVLQAGEHCPPQCRTRQRQLQDPPSRCSTLLLPWPEGRLDHALALMLHRPTLRPPHGLMAFRGPTQAGAALATLSKQEIGGQHGSQCELGTGAPASMAPRSLKIEKGQSP